ncbi:MAG: 2-oxoacid:acceptor oxidoreductase family protein [Thermodesulfobacteriota bacterium]
MNQKMAISGLGGQGVLLVTRLLAEAALNLGLEVLSSENHGMAVRGGAVVSHLKVGPYSSPLIRAGQADLVLFLAEENLEVHPQLIGPKTKVVVNTPNRGDYENLDAGRVAELEVGRRQAENLVLLGFALGRGHLFASPEAVRAALRGLSRNEKSLQENEKALAAGFSRAGG